VSSTYNGPSVKYHNKTSFSNNKKINAHSSIVTLVHSLVCCTNTATRLNLYQPHIWLTRRKMKLLIDPSIKWNSVIPIREEYAQVVRLELIRTSDTRGNEIMMAGVIASMAARTTSWSCWCRWHLVDWWREMARLLLTPQPLRLFRTNKGNMLSSIISYLSKQVFPPLLLAFRACVLEGIILPLCTVVIIWSG
jgi:hypothetical protein